MRLIYHSLRDDTEMLNLDADEDHMVLSSEVLVELDRDLEYVKR